ncbi:hypothetical protein EV363DRAFT_1330227 [Boletus edulis]|uniref:Plasma membrane proteolipid 3 n=1 Tax=Boletus edulis BED1 TaxID=1328754 RepID=A0AAD4BPC3_BOLED|nr:hypothetical protein EV363DRAFT_1330227 [Boletus edulis]KAF8423751.1 hypothetical protein L210DRAFT_3569406 [Boletus edulis BED1]KAF8435735.1 hypothetical protein L210DRAFT_3550485 [Boletus edulis BED1]
MVKASNIFLIIVAIIFPPAAVGFIAGCGCDFLINICLTTLGLLPGHIHAYWLIRKKMQAEKRYGEGGFIYTGGGQYQARNDQPAPPV